MEASERQQRSDSDGGAREDRDEMQGKMNHSFDKVDEGKGEKARSLV